MRNFLVVTAVAGVLVLGTSVPASGLPRALEDVASASQAGLHPRSYVDDPDTYLFYLTQESSSNCGGNVSCDIKYSSYMIDKDNPASLGVVVGMAGPTDAEISNSEQGGLLLYLDSDDDRRDWDYSMWTRYRSYPLKQSLESTIYEWDGDSWEQSRFTGSWYRSDNAWVALVPWQSMGIKSAIAAVRASDASGAEDFSPGESGTPMLPMAALVAGAPGSPGGLTATPGMGQVSLSWKAPVTTGASAVTSYTVTASPGGATCTTASTTCIVTGLTGGSTYSFSVAATNAQGTGPASDPVSATPGASVPAAPTNLRATYAAKGGKSTATVSWTRPAGATSMQVRWAPNGGAWTAWKPVKADKIAVPGLVKGKTTSFEARGVNAGGPGAVAGLTLSPK